MIFSRPLTKFKCVVQGTLLRQFHNSHIQLTSISPSAVLDKRVYDRYMCLPIPDCKFQVTYLFIDATGENVCCKSRTLDYCPTTFKEVPVWVLNGHHTMKAPKNKSDYYLVPVSMYNDPVRRGHNKIVMCETFDADERPCKTNFRQKCVEALNKVCEQEVYFGFQQQYLITGFNGCPFGWPSLNGEPSTEKQYYAGMCSVVGRELSECIYRALLYAGVHVYSQCANATPALWEIKTAGERGIKPADDLWFARWTMQRIAEDFGICITFNAKLPPRWDTPGLHFRFSTKNTRDADGVKCLQEFMTKLAKNHKDMMCVYKKEDPCGKFSSGIGDRTASIRIPKLVADKKKGYFEDRRPAGHADPYRIMEAVVKTLI